MKDLSEIPFFFIVGRPRAGTTLLRILFDAHPNVIIPWECQYIINLYPRYHNVQSWTKELLEDFYDDLMQQWQFKFWTVDFDELKSNLLSCEGEISFGNLCKVVHTNFQSFYDKKDLKIIGDKNLGYTIYIEKLKKIYPDAKFIHITRDYRDNYYSIKRVDFELPILSVVVYKWRYFVKQVLKAKRKFPDSVYILRYEDLVEHPEIHFRNICRFLQIPYVPEVFEFYKKKEEVQAIMKTERAKKHHASLLNPISTKRTGLWKKNLTEKEIKLADHVAGRYAKKAGYKREYRRANLWTILKAFPGIMYARMLYFLTAIINRFPYKMRAVILSKGPLGLARLYRKINPKFQSPNSK